MKIFRTLGVLAVLSFALLAQACQPPVGTAVDQVIVTVTDPDGMDPADLLLIWGTYEELTGPNPGQKYFSSPTFPLQYTITNPSKSSFFVVGASNTGQTAGGSAVVDTSKGGVMKVTIALTPPPPSE